ncbi:MAG: hypothetical protein Aurels2KO_44190 [Aureliella sp.]
MTAVCAVHPVAECYAHFEGARVQSKFEKGKPMWLAAHFFSEGRITGDQFARAAVEQIRRRKPLGQVALIANMLSMKQIMSILAEQANHPEMAFGEIAISLQLLTSEQVAELLYTQAQEVPTLEEMLVQTGALTENELQQALHSRDTIHDAVPPAPAQPTLSDLPVPNAPIKQTLG